MSQFSKISLGRPSKTYKHNMSFDNNTTFGFGDVQPVLTQYMEGNDKFSLNLRQFLRLAPLPLPTFGRVHVQNEFRFVPITEVCPYYEALLSQQNYAGGRNVSYYPTTVPYTDNKFLVQVLCLKYCDFNVLIHDTSSRQDLYKYASNSVPSGKLDPSKPADLTQLNTKLQDFWQGYIDYIGSLDVSHFEKLTYDSNEVRNPSFDIPRPDPTLPAEPTTGTTYSTISLESADFVVKVDDDYIFLFRLNSAGRRLRKVLVGCGFSLDCSDSDSLSILPLLAFYKAYFDTYVPQRTVNWISTNTYALIKYIEDNYYTNFSNFSSDTESEAFDMFIDFLFDLSECWYTQPDDFVSAHRDTPVTLNRSVTVIDGGDELQILSNDVQTPSDVLPYQSTGGNFNWLTIQGLRLITRFVNKDSVIGGKLSDWIKVHYGSDVSNSLFKQTNRIGSFRLDAQISDVFSTADTASSDGGEVLGSFAGKGLGYNTSKFDYTAPSHGFAIMLSCVVPDSGYFQGNDASLYLIDRDHIPYPEYDALGYEVTPKSMLFDDRGLCSGSGNLSQGFGFVPRYSSLKRKRNIVNGDMSRRGSVDSYSGYYLDRIVSSKEVSSIPMSDGSVQLQIHSAEIPTATDEWRYPTKYPWLGNPNRIFYNSGVNYHGVSFDGDELIDDNFSCQMIFEFFVTNKYKPISQSYDTFDEGTDDSSQDVSMD
ncbi:hypothetical protein [Leyella lascolaii]|uniref:hypothetical protein n=1 Tax=Leyella lascolaii TaxID=1776379 RepID=UPI002942A064|nr:hypothetical protein [Leyella lascolaii]